jgi:pyruvate dehydrogenase E1 component beta subunit
MLWTALEDPDPVVIFEHGSLYGVEDELADDAGPVDIDRAVVRRPGTDVTLIGWGGTLRLALDAADRLASQGTSAEVIDLRSLRPLDAATVVSSVTRTHRAVVVDEGWGTAGFSAEVAARIAEDAFYDLDAPVARVCTAEVPIPYAKHLEDAALPQVDDVVEASRRTLGVTGG